MRIKSKAVVLSSVMVLVFLFILLSGVLVAPNQPVTTANLVTQRLAPTSVSSTPTSVATATAEPTAIPTPTALPPTATPEPTATPTPIPPTATPEPTATPTPVVAPVIPFAERFTFRKTDTVRYLKPGIIHVQRLETGPIRLNVLLFDMTSPELNLRVALQDDWLSGVARTSTFARANNAIAAVNGDLFSGNGLPQGMTMSDGKLALAPKRRATFAYSKDTGPFIGYFTQNFTWSSSVIAANGERHSLEVLNTTCKDNWLCIYNDLYHQIAAAPNDVRVVLDAASQVTAIKQEVSVAVGTGQQVLVGKGLAGKWLLQNAKVGDKLDLNMVTDPDYHNFQQIVSGGPVFLRNGQFVQDCLCNLEDCTDSKQKDVLCEEFTTEWKLLHYLSVRMPRNAIGYTPDKSVLMVAVVDGYQAGYSIGMTQHELADLMTEFGVGTAMELDGGGSATMFVDGKVASHPSDGNGSVERMVPDALVFQWNDQATDGATNGPSTTPAARNSTPAPTSPTPASKYGTTPAPTVANPTQKSVRSTPTATPRSGGSNK